jgi:hypothetical protein
MVEKEPVVAVPVPITKFTCPKSSVGAMWVSLKTGKLVAEFNIILNLKFTFWLTIEAPVLFLTVAW